MALEEGDPDALKRNVLHLLLQNPLGVNFGDFTGAFYQLHGYHPHITRHGYHSLRELVADMEDAVVLQDESQNPVIKIANGFHLDHWQEGGEVVSSSEGKAWSLTDEERSEEETALAEVLESLTSLLSKYGPGLRIKKVQEFLLANDGVDVEKFSIQQGYNDTLEFLEYQMPELNIKYKEDRLSCVVHLPKDVSAPSSSAGSENLVEEPTNQTSGLMALEEGDPDALKRNVLHLLLQNPLGVNFGDFTGAFYQLHGYHPHITRHGYHSLRELVADMEDAVVLQGESQNPVIKIANGFHLDHWQEGGEVNGVSSSEGEAWSLTDEERSEEETALAEVLESLTSLLSKYGPGLRIKKVQEFLLANDVDVEKFSIQQGYNDTLEFLEYQMPELNIKYKEDRLSCVVHLPKDVSAPSSSAGSENLVEEPTNQTSDLLVALEPIRNVLDCHPEGLKMKKLKKDLKEKHGFDLEMFCLELGYKDVMSCLRDIPGLILQNGNKTRNCVVQLESRCSSPAPSLDTDFSVCSSNTTAQELTRKKSGTSSPTPSLDSGFSACNSNAVPPSLIGKKSDLAAALVPILDVLGGHPLGLNLKALKEILEKKHGFDLESFSRYLGYEDVMSCLLDVPGLRFAFTNGEGPHNCVVQLLSGSLGLSSVPLHAGSSLTHWKTEVYPKIPSQELTETKPASCISTMSQSSASVSLDLEQSASKSKTLKQNVLGKKPVLTEVLALLTSLLTMYSEGLRVKKVQELLLATEKFDLEKFSISQGCKDTLEFLERQMPTFNIRYRENRLKCVVHVGSEFGWISKPSFTICDSSVNKSQIRSLPAPAALVSPPLYDGLHTNLCVPTTTFPNSPSSQEPRSTLSGKAKDSSQPLASIHPQQPRACQSGGPLSFEKEQHLLSAQLPRKSNLTNVQPSKDLEELKHQVAHILALHPEGLSLFQFRAAYSTAYQQHLPLGNASSAKQRLQEMPDTVCLKGYGVQTLLLPVSSKVLPVKSDQPVSSKVENAAVVPGHSLPQSVAVAEPIIVLKPSPLPKAPGPPQPHPISDHLKELGDKDCCILSKGQAPRMPKMVPSLQEHGRATADLQELSGQADLSQVEEPAGVLGPSSPKIKPVVLKSCLKSGLPKAAMLPVPQPCLSLLQSAEQLGSRGSKESSPSLGPPLQKTPKPVAPIQEHVRMRPKPVGSPKSPVFPADSQTTGWGENLKSDSLGSKPAHLANPWFSNHSVPPPSHSQTVSASSGAWSRPVTFVPSNSSLYPAIFVPDSVKASGIQFPKIAPRTPSAQSVSPGRLAEQVSPTQIPQRRPHVSAVSKLDPFSQKKVPSRTIGCPHSPALAFSAVSLPSQNPASLHPTQSQAVHESEYYHHLWLDGLQHSSVPVKDKSPVIPSLDKVPSKPLASTYWGPCDDANSPVTSPGTLLLSSQSASTNATQPSSYATYTHSSNSDVLPSESSAILHQRQDVSVNSAIRSSSTRPASSPLSPLETTTTPSQQPFYTSSRISSNSSALLSEPRALMHQRQYVSVSSSVTLSTWPEKSSPPSPLETTSTPSRKPSYTTARINSNSDAAPSEPRAIMYQRQYAIRSSSTPFHQSYAFHGNRDYGSPSQNNLPTEAGKQDSPSVSLTRKQMPYSSPPQNSRPPKNDNKCIIL
ncbi:uncharacterized protein LOC133367295 isoform X2 [Rhineura floridana]|nr:uncharacterized protein LOC133367295 isoform X2 [Rhineura floridana]XP_061447377.1 uncharacterized protein LOC133367295 isoform X2 [Rhineura floridana]XP_061447378.1 uncharacterized protein LOC133367295 isoform X2 [Rhineura floridana]XP_061447379.1 uncharacterized protein LOC133367295 isoform X2 [Rhineura floridana]